MSDPKQAKLMVSLGILCETEEQALRVIEVLSRPLLGLAMDNLHGDLSVTPVSEEDIDQT